MSEDTAIDTPAEHDETPPAAPAATFAEDNAAGADDPAVAALLERTAVEYGRFTARGPLTFGGQLAFTPGSPVPTHHPHVEGCPDLCGCGAAGWLADDLLDDATPGEPIVPEEL